MTKKIATFAVFSIIAVMTLSCGGGSKCGKKCKSRCKTCTSLVQSSLSNEQVS